MDGWLAGWLAGWKYTKEAIVPMNGRYMNNLRDTRVPPVMEVGRHANHD